MSIWTSIRHAILGDMPADASPHLFDMENRLGNMPGASRLNWQSSASDLLELIGVEPTEENRTALAGELGYDGPDDVHVRDPWLHERMLRQLEEEGGAI